MCRTDVTTVRLVIVVKREQSLASGSLRRHGQRRERPCAPSFASDDAMMPACESC